MPSTVLTQWQALIAHMDNVVGNSGNGSSLDIRSFAEGELLDDDASIPSVFMQFIDMKEDTRTDDDRVWVIRFKIRVTSRVVTALKPFDEILAKIAQLNDQMDTFTIVASVLGIYGREWSITPGTSGTNGEIIVAEALAKMAVIVNRGT